MAVDEQQIVWSFYLSGPSMLDRDGILIRFHRGYAERLTASGGWDRLPAADYLTGPDPRPRDGGRMLSHAQAREWLTAHHLVPKLVSA